MVYDKPRAVSLFAGIGGFDLGFERAGFETIFQCEKDSFCSEILKRHWPGATRHSDIKELDGEAIPAADVWTAGVPCQDVSLARMSSPRKGLRGKRSGLFFEFARLLGQKVPRVCVIENVPGLLSSHKGRDFQLIIQTLVGLGYGVAWRLLNSRYFGIPQSRRRIYIVGCHRDWGSAGEILFEQKRRQRHAEKGAADEAESISPFKKIFGDPRKGPIVQGLAYCLYACSARHTGTDWSRTYVSYPNGRVRRLMPVECERIQGFPDGWTDPQHPEMDVEKADTLRYNALGNAVSVPVAEWIAGRIRRNVLSKEPLPETTSVLPLPRTDAAGTRASASRNGSLAARRQVSSPRNRIRRQG